MGIVERAKEAAGAAADAATSAVRAVGDTVGSDDDPDRPDALASDEPPSDGAPSRPRGNVDDDPLDGDERGEQLPALELSGPDVDADVAALDERAARGGDEPPHLPDDPGLWNRIDRGGSVDTGVGVGLQTLVTNLADLGLDDGAGTFDLGLVRTILRPVGDRLSIAADERGITVTGLVRRRTTRWDEVERLRVASRYDLFSGQGIGALSGSIIGKITPPIPGLQWVVTQVIGAMGGMLERLLVRGDLRESLQSSAGWALVEVERPWFDVRLDGLMLLVSGLAKGTVDTIVAEAERRGIPVERA